MQEQAVARTYLFTADLKAAPAENFTPFDAAIWTGSPVRGLRPVRAARDERENEPKPGSVTLSSFATAPCTASMSAFNARSASALLSPAPSAMLSTSSDLFTLASEMCACSKEVERIYVGTSSISTSRGRTKFTSTNRHTFFDVVAFGVTRFSIFHSIDVPIDVDRAEHLHARA